MPRIRKRTTTNRSYTEENLKIAVQQVNENKMMIRTAAREFKIPRATLKRYIVKAQNDGFEQVNFRPKNEHLKVFSAAQEEVLAKYLKQASCMNYGLTLKEARKLAYDFAVANNNNLRTGLENWTRTMMAGKEWMLSFLKRYKLFLRTPESTSLSRATSFNRHNVAKFFENLKAVLDANKFEPSDIYNLDETVRQGTLREYLPPSNTEKPRPFQPGYPPAGFSPEPPFPFPTNPATGGVTAPGGYQPPGDNGLLPPEQGSGGGENGYPKSDMQPTGEPLPTESAAPISTTQLTEQPTEKGLPHEEPGYSTSQPTGQPGYTTGQPGYTTGQPTGQPGYTTGRPTGTPTLTSEHPGSYPTVPSGIPDNVPSVTTLAPPYSTTEHPGRTEGTPENLYTSKPAISTSGPEQTQPSFPPYTSPEITRQPPQEGTTGYPAASQPQPTPGFPTIQPGGQVSTSIQPGESTRLPVAPGSTFPTEAPSLAPEQPASPEGTIAPEGPGPSTLGSTLPSLGTSVPSGFTTSTPSVPSEARTPAQTTQAGAESETAGTTLSPEVNTIPGPGKPEPSVVDEEDLKHPPHIHAINVQCSKEMMTINIEFNREFNGVIYSKGHYSTPECRYVQENSGQSKYTFTVNLEMCGTEFVNAFDTQNQSYLENVLVLQNEAGIQEVWDTVRSVRCLWEGNLKDTLSVAFSIGMLSQEIVTFSGDSAMAKLDVVLGRGPFGEPANGLVKIGEQMTLVVSVSGDPGFDLQVKDCKAVDSQGKNSVALTDDDGCILKPKLFGAFQKTKETGNTGASIIAYAYFNAFKFPDEMDLMIECNIELCKTDCDMCSKEGQQLEPAKRRRRDVSYNNTGDWITMGKLVKVILPEDLNEQTALEVTARDHICMSIHSFIFSTALLVSLLVITSFISVCLWIKRREKMYLKY